MAFWDMAKAAKEITPVKQEMASLRLKTDKKSMARKQEINREAEKDNKNSSIKNEENAKNFMSDYKAGNTNSSKTNDTVLFKPGTASQSLWKSEKSFDKVLDTQKKAREEQSKSRKAYADFARDILSDMGAFGRNAGEMTVKKANNRLSDDEAIGRLGMLSFEDVAGLYRKNKDYEKYLSDNASSFDYADWIQSKERAKERSKNYSSLLHNLTPSGKAATGDEGLSDEAYRFKMDNLTEADAKSYANFYEKKASEKNIDYPDRVRYKSIADTYRKKYIDIKYGSIKNNPDFEEKSKSSGYDASALPVDPRKDGAVLDKTEKYTLMTSNEREIYHYMKNTKGNKEAEDYLKFIEPEIDKRYSEYAVKKAEAVGREHPVAATVISIASSPANAVGAFVDNAKAAVTGKVNELDYLSVNQKSALREGVMNEHIKSKAGQIIYSSFTSAVDNALNALVAKGLVGATALSGAAKAKAIGRIGGALMGSEAAASGILAGKANGMSDRGAVAYGIAQGVIELLTEKYSIEKIMGESGTVVRTFLKNSFTEGSEEIASYWANMVLDEIAGQGVEKKYKGLIAQGYSAEEASKQIVTDIVYGNLESFIGGALAGGMMSAGTTLPGVISAGGVKNYNKQLELANQYNNMSEEERKEFDRKMAAEQAANVLSGDKVGPVEVATALDILGVPEPDKAAKAIENFKDSGKTSERLHNDSRVADVMEILNERGYFSKNKEDVTQVLHDEISSLGATSENELASPTSDDSVTQTEGKVKGENENFRNETKKSDYVPPIKVNTSNENDRNMVKTITDGIGKEGRRAYHERIELEYTAGYNGNKAVFLRDFNAFYTKGFTGGKISEVNSRFSDRLTLGTRKAAFAAGQADRAAAIDAKYTEANRAVIRDGGLILNHNTEGREDIERLDELGKKFGVSIEIQDTVVNSRGNEVNGLYSQGEIKISKKAVDSFKSPEAAERFILGHELLHRVETLAPKQYVNLRERIYDYVQRQNGAEITAAENAVLKKDVDMDTAIDEIAADYIGNEKFALDTAMHDLTLAEKIRGMARDILNVLGIKKYSEAERIARVWEKACNEAKRTVKNADKRVGNDVKAAGSQKKYSNDDLKVTAEDIQAVQSVGRKSINDFTSEDIKKTESFARKYFKEMGVKSPFFRAWFGDWRANDNTPIKTVQIDTEANSIPKGIFKNSDTGWNINVSAVGIRDTVSHSGKEKLSVLAMNNIDSIIKNAVLLDSEVSEVRGQKGQNTLFMHKLYALNNIGDKTYISKLSVEEYGNGNDTGKRFYNLREIKISPALGRLGTDNGTASTMRISGDSYTVSQLFNLVKASDKNFLPREASKVVNEDGTPKIVYHGTSNGGFNTFDIYGGNFGLFGEGAYFTENSQIANEYTNKGHGSDKQVYACYLDIKNPIDMDAKADINAWEKALNEIDEISVDFGGVNTNEDAYRAVLEELEYNDYGRYEAYDFVNSLMMEHLHCDGITHIGGGRRTNSTIRHRVWIAFDSTQIKSATDNRGTFDRNNADIRYSSGDLNEVIKENEKLKKENEKLKELKDHYKGQMLRSPNQYAPSSVNIKKIVNRVAKGYTGNRNLAEDIKQAQELLSKCIASSGKGNTERANELYNQYKERIDFIAGDIANNTRQKNDSLYREYRSIKDSLKGVTVKVDESWVNDLNGKNGYTEFKKRNLGTVRMSLSSGTPIDVLYNELGGRFGELFPEEIVNSADQLIYLVDLLKSMSDFYENPYNGDMDAAIEGISESIDLELLALSGERTQADKYFDEAQKQIEAANAERDEAIKSSRERYNQKIEAFKAEQRQKRADNARKKEEMSARQKLLTLSRRMKRIAKNGKTTQANQALINELIGHVDTIAVSMTDRTVRNLESLSAWYQEAAKRINFVPNPRIEEDLARLDEEKIGEMDIKRVIALTEALQNIEKQIEIADKEIGKKGNVYEKGMGTIEHIKNSGGSAAYGLGHIKDSIITGLINPVNEIRRLTGYVDDDALYQTTRDLRDAETVEMYHEMRANKLFEKYNTDKKFMKHLKEDFKEFNVKQYDKFGKETGEKTVRLNPAMIISLAQLAKNNSSLLHMTEGGVRIADEELYKRGKYKEAFDRGFVVKIVAPEIKKITETLTEQDKAYMKMVETYFNEIAKEEINAVSQELDGVDRARVGFYFPMNTDSAFLVKEFDSIAYDKSVENMGSLKERITRAKNPLLLMAVPDVVSRAIKNNGRYIAYAIPLRNFKKLWNTMSHGDLVQVPDRDKYGNVRVDENGETVMKDVFTSNFDASIKDTVQKVWGQNAVDYVENFINDIETGRNEKTSKFTKWINKRHSKYIKAVLSKNLPVAVNQVASYPSAAAVLGWEPLLKALKDVGKVNLDLISRYTAVQWNRTKGGYDPTVADAYESGGKLSKLSDWLMASDAIITRKLWKASEYYIRQHNPDLKIGTDEYYREVAKIYEKVMQETQPNSGIMERPEVLRSDSFTRFAMPFTGEPLKNVNLIYDAIGNVQAKKRQLDRVAGTQAQQDAEKRLKEAKQYAVRVLASQLVANIAFNVFVSVAKIATGGRGGRKKYEDEEGNITLASYFMELGKDIVLNTVTQVPFTSDIIDLISAMANDEMKYYAPNMISVQAITDAAEALINTKRLIHKAIRSEAGTWKEIAEEVNYNLVKASTYAGAALKNYENIANSLTYWVTKVIYHDNKTMQKYVMEKLSGAIVERTKDEETGEFVYKPTKEAKALLYNAFKNGEYDNYETILFDLVDDGVKASDLESAMRSFSQKDEKFNIESSLGAAAGVKKGVDYELYEMHLEEAEKAEVSEEDLKKGIDIIESGKPYKKMYEEITSFTRGMTDKQIAFFDKIARGKYTPDELGTKEYKEFSEKRGQTVDELENQLDTSGLGNKEMNDIYNKIYQYAENVALEEASGGEYIIDTEWINEAKKSQETIGVNTAEFIRLYNKYDSKVYSTETVITKELGYDIKLSLEYSRLKSIKGTESERDENGQIIKGKSKQDKIIAIIDSMDITDEEKAYLFGIEYKSNDNNKWARSQKVNYKKYVEERKNAK